MNENKSPNERVEAVLARAFRGWTGAGAPDMDARTRDFCFHMTDWADDLHALAALMRNPAQSSDEQWERAVMNFLVHASGHIAAAAKLADVEPVKFDIPSKPRAAKRQSKQSLGRRVGVQKHG